MITDTIDETLLTETGLGVPLTATREQYSALLHRISRTKTGNADYRDLLVAHSAHMPPRYWARVDNVSLDWHLRVLRAFFLRLNADGPNVTAPVVRWRHIPEHNHTEVAVCTWDRLGLMARVAGAFAEVGVNILRADVYTRADNVVLDLFHVRDGVSGGICNEKRLLKMRRLLGTLFHPERELDVLDRVPTLPSTVTPMSLGNPDLEPPTTHWNLELSDEYSVLEIEACDRLGLLYTIFRVLADFHLNVAQAIITTENDRAGDVFFVTARDGRKVTNHALMENVRAKLLAALA